MKILIKVPVKSSDTDAKAATGIAGFDEITRGGLPRGRTTLLQVSTLADTWIHLKYLVQAGERNRGMSIVKSRGTAHSNQVRELILSDKARMGELRGADAVNLDRT